MSAEIAVLNVLAEHGWMSKQRKCLCNWRPDDRIRQFPEPQQHPLVIQWNIHLAAEIVAGLGLRQEWSHGFAPDEPTQGHIYDEREPAEAMRLAVLRSFPEAVVLTRTLTDWRADEEERS